MGFARLKKANSKGFAMQDFILSPARAVVFEIMQRRAFFYPLVEVGQTLGIAAQTSYNQALAGTFPIKNKKLGGRRVVALDDLADFLAGGPRPVASMPPSAEKKGVKRRGRPTKASQISKRG